LYISYIQYDQKPAVVSLLSTNKRLFFQPNDGVNLFVTLRWKHVFSLFLVYCVRTLSTSSEYCCSLDMSPLLHFKYIILYHNFTKH